VASQEGLGSMELVDESVPRLYSVDDVTINECGTVCVMRTGTGN
jgi:hypothetical protein